MVHCIILLVSAELRGRCPSEVNQCPARASPCSADDECGEEQICCNTKCGVTCVNPLFTGTSKLYIYTSTLFINYSLGADILRSKYYFPFYYRFIAKTSSPFFKLLSLP